MVGRCWSASCLRYAAVATLGLLLLGTLLPGAALSSPFPDSPDPRIISGFEFLPVGWLGPLSGHFGWYANPALIAALYLPFQGRRPRLALSLLPILIASSCFVAMPIYLYNDPLPHWLSRFEAGFWIWYAACAMPLAIWAMACTPAFGSGERRNAEMLARP